MQIELQGMPVIPEEDGLGSLQESLGLEEQEAAALSPKSPAVSSASPKSSLNPPKAANSSNGKSEQPLQGVPNNMNTMLEDPKVD